jgi:hypothetical protein
MSSVKITALAKVLYEVYAAYVGEDILHWRSTMGARRTAPKAILSLESRHWELSDKNKVVLMMENKLESNCAFPRYKDTL